MHRFLIALGRSLGTVWGPICLPPACQGAALGFFTAVYSAETLAAVEDFRVRTAEEERQDGARRHSLVSPTTDDLHRRALCQHGAWPAMRDRKASCLTLTLYPP